MIRLHYVLLEHEIGDFIQDLRRRVANNAVEQLYDEWKDSVSTHKCENCEETKGDVYLKADVDALIIIEKHDFCCSKMMERMKFEIRDK